MCQSAYASQRELIAGKAPHAKDFTNATFQKVCDLFLRSS